jgi:hypothetical protein
VAIGELSHIFMAFGVYPRIANGILWNLAPAQVIRQLESHLVVLEAELKEIYSDIAQLESMTRKYGTSSTVFTYPSLFLTVLIPLDRILLLDWVAPLDRPQRLQGETYS